MTTQTNVLSLAANRRQKVATRKSERLTKRLRNQLRTAQFVAGVDLIMIGLSLSHLAHGVEVVTNCSCYEAWAMAAAIDLTFTGLEVSKITSATEHTRRQVAKWANPTIAATMIGSAVMNAVAFSAQADGSIMKAAAAAFGVVIPLLIFSTTQVATKMWMAR